MKSLDGQIAALQAQAQQAQTDFDRTEDLAGRGTIPRTRLDEARTALNVAQNTLRSRIAERSVIQQQLDEGKVLAPAAGRILKVPLTAGAVLLPGETVATIAEGAYVLRLRVPERHARFLKVGDAVRIDGAELGQAGPALRHGPPDLSADRGWARRRRCRRRRAWRLFRQRAAARVGIERRAAGDRHSVRPS